MEPSYNPYAAPKAHVADEPIGEEGSLRETPDSVPAGQGFAWIGEGWQLFTQSKGLWIGIFVLYVIILAVLSKIPFVTNLIGPVLFGGLMLGCRALDRGEPLKVGHLFSGFQNNVGQLLLVGVVALAYVVAVAVIAGIFTVGGAAGIGILAGHSDPRHLAGLGAATFLVFILVYLALVIPLSMALWFAPPLIVFHDMPAFKAMGLSFKGSLRNILPALLYGIALLVLGVLAVIPLGLGLLVWGPVIFASTYAAYKDIFLE
jgi:uncharacterized membrane protein